MVGKQGVSPPIISSFNLMQGKGKEERKYNKDSVSAIQWTDKDIFTFILVKKKLWLTDRLTEWPRQPPE